MWIWKFKIILKHGTCEFNHSGRFNNPLQNIVTNDWNLNEIHASNWNAIWYILHPNIFVMNLFVWMIETWMTNHLVNANNYNIINLYFPQKNFTRSDKVIMWGYI